MSAIRGTENQTERALRSTLHRLGLRFRKYAPDLLGRPDIIFRAQRVAVFVDGDYWHGRVFQERGLPALRASIRKQETQNYWLAKLQRTVARDREVTRGLRSQGWLVMRLWESETKRNLSSIAQRIAKAVRRRSTSQRTRNGPRS